MVFACRRNVSQKIRSLAIEQPVRDEQGGPISWAHNTKEGMARVAIAVEVSPEAVVAASGGGGRHR